MSFDKKELAEFLGEAMELIEEAEKNPLEVEKGHDTASRHDAIFRSFHRLKVTAGMLELEALGVHVQQWEDLFAKFKGSLNLSAKEITFFLKELMFLNRYLTVKNSLLTTKSRTKLYLPPNTEPIKTDVFIIDDEQDLIEILSSNKTKAVPSWKDFTNPAEVKSPT